MSSENLLETFFTDEQQDSLHGKTFAHYQIEEKLGEGGMGIVYRAYDTRLRNIVALKIVQGNSSLQSTQRFLREASATAQLNHPGIVRFYEVGDKPQPYFTMEYIEGVTLAQVIKEKRITDELIIDIMIQACDALSAAHQKKILHRDIKPSNIMIDRQGIVKIMDFGLAKQLADDRTQLSCEGSPLGTLQYMSPEQARGETSIRSDVYSLGSTLYEAITYRPLFQGDQISLMYQIFHDEPLLPRKLDPGISPYLEAICLKCVHRKPEKRYKSFKQLSSDLKNFQAHRPISAKKYNQWNTITNFVQRQKALCVFLLIALLATVGAFFYISKSNKEIQQKSAEKDIHRTLENLSLFKQYLTLRDYNSAIKHFDNANNTLKNSEVEKILKNASSNAIDKDLQIVFPFLPIVLQTIENYVLPHLPTPKKQKLIHHKILKTLQSSPYFVAYILKNKTVIENKISKEKITVDEIFDYVSFSDDGSTTALYKQRKLRILEVKTKQFLDISIEHLQEIARMKISFNNRFIYISGKTGVLFDRHKQKLHSVKNGVPCFRRDNKMLVIGESTKILNRKSEFLRLPSLQKLKLVDNSEKIYAKSLHFDFKGKALIAMRINDIEIYTLDFKKNNEVNVQKRSIIANAHSGKCLKTEISPDRKILATLGLDDKLKIWNIPQLRKIRELSIQDLQENLIAKDVNHMCFSPDGNRIDLVTKHKEESFIYSLDIVKCDKILDFQKNESLTKNKIKLLQQTLGIRSEKQFQIAISSEGKRVAYYLLPGLFIWNTKSEKLTTLKESIFLGDCQFLKFSDDQRYLFYSGKLVGKLNFYCWDLQTQKQLFVKNFEQVMFFPNSDFFFIRDNKKSNVRKLYRFEKGKLNLASIPHQTTHSVHVCAFNSKTKQIVYANHNEQFLWFFSVIDGKTRNIKLRKHTNKITALHFINDREIMVGSENGYISIVNTSDGTVRLGPKIYKTIQSFSFDGRAYFAKTKHHLYLLPPFSDFEGKLLHVLPLSVIGDNYYHSLQVNPKLKNAALLKRTGEVLFWSLGK
ncbi:protein kinase [Candidatus Uabimicrobium sp. HlEnr_7]|uniref:protein kinase domain-containing protein n=1 Tax=Candidatus Uabimicrobium helgolandensis TaxID=3095367 RepID=UPI003559188B